jgi:S-adenosylmethionine/arginine decarboxylase-like enzyme
MIGGFVRTTNGLTTLVANDMAKLTMTTGAALVQKPYSVPDADWQYSGTLTTTSAAAAKAAGAASIRNYVTAFQYQNISATATTVIILDGATAIHTLYAPANMTAPAVMDFPTPLRGTAATALNVNCGTTAANVLVNLQGYQAP